MAKRTVVKKVENCVLYSDGLIKIENVRLSYAHLDQPYAGKGDDGKPKGEPKYSVIGIMPKATHAAAQKLILAQITALCAEKKWVNKEGKRTIPATHLCLKNGDSPDDDAAAKEEYANAWTISAREKTRPILRDRKANAVPENRINDIFYSG